MLNAFLRSLSYHPTTRWLFRDVRIGNTSKKRTAPLRKITTSAPREQKDITLKGTLCCGSSLDLAVDGYDFRRDSGTWVFGDLALGSQVNVIATKRADGTLYAKKINVLA